ncbi:hypothetical protein [Phenylobacterium sp.]|uniref:hypothetical protein n=1 Tax=Phenylobacterium sp. TaxID=1871053 RepID=UPI0027324DE6|nr:hypothetical protein [Phenylobacterium sp.]MDP3175847.1 hypothetical protein [Phenylobacterium sp.]MDP3659063.1 hypothetical protein [Phenylobacterium sp.]
MAEEQFVQMYVRDFANLAARAESGTDVDALVRKRIEEARKHAALMDLRKSEGHLAAVSQRLRLESRRNAAAAVRNAPDPIAAAARRESFMQEIADLLDADPTEPIKRGVERF